jgi:hypothetical protein
VRECVYERERERGGGTVKERVNGKKERMNEKKKE